VKHDRNLVAAMICKAMERAEEIKRRLAGQLARARESPVVATGEHLIYKELREREQGTGFAVVTGKVLGQEKKTRLLVCGGTEEEMDIF
jgi:large subunit ribosomal protein L24e